MLYNIIYSFTSVNGKNMLLIITSLLILSGTILLLLGLNALQRRDRPEAIAFAVTMFCASIWSYGFAIDVVSQTLQYKIFWANIQYLGISFLPLSWLMTTLHYTGQPRWMIRKLPLLSVVLLLSILVIWTDPYHHFFRINPSLDTANPFFPVLNNDYGIFYYAIYGPYNYLLYIISLFLLARFAFKSASIYRRKVLTLFLGLSLPFLVDLLHVFSITPIPHFTFAPIFFSISGLVSWKVFSFSFLDITPLANDVIIRKIQVAVLVLDKEGLISDLNPAFEEITNISIREYIGTPIVQVLPILATYLNIDSDTQADIILEKEGEEFHYDLRVSPIHGRRERILGRVFTLNDISERMKLYQQVEKASTEDSLTGTLTRRAFALKGEREIARAQRYKKELSVIMIDFDDFKSINDNFGHKYGDEALRVVTCLCHEKMRSVDQIARYGGDEFVILLPETLAKNAFSFAQRIHKDILETNLTTEQGIAYSLNVSMGVAGLHGNQTLESLLHEADQALYEAKHRGKGQVFLSGNKSFMEAHLG